MAAVAEVNNKLNATVSTISRLVLILCFERLSVAGHFVVWKAISFYLLFLINLFLVPTRCFCCAFSSANFVQSYFRSQTFHYWNEALIHHSRHRRRLVIDDTSNRALNTFNLEGTNAEAQVLLSYTHHPFINNIICTIGIVHMMSYHIIVLVIEFHHIIENYIAILRIMPRCNSVLGSSC